MASANVSSMPSIVADFADDPRISFNTVTSKWEFEDDGGQELEWDTLTGRWVPIVDEELVRQQQAVYNVEGVDENTPAAPVAARENKKRKPQDLDAPSNAGPNKKKGKKGANDNPNAPKSQPKNTAVYVSHLPSDATAEEIAERFGKFGVIMEDDAGEPRIKMYANERGEFNGDALVVYFMEDSVNLAVNLLDEAELRLGDTGSIMRVKRAEFEHKKSEGGAEVHKRVMDKKKATQRIVKMKTKVGDWNFDDGFGPMEEPEEKEPVIASRVVVLKYMFTLDELRDDPSLLLDLKEDVREEAETVGDVTNVVLYDDEPEGVMTVKFRDPISAQACILKMNGRWFSGRKIEASFFTGQQRFKKSGHGADNEEAIGEKERLEQFEKWLMDEGEKD